MSHNVLQFVDSNPRDLKQISTAGSSGSGALDLLRVSGRLC
jgi:hypothetical protein